MIMERLDRTIKYQRETSINLRPSQTVWSFFFAPQAPEDIEQLLLVEGDLSTKRRSVHGTEQREQKGMRWM